MIAVYTCVEYWEMAPSMYLKKCMASGRLNTSMDRRRFVNDRRLPEVDCRRYVEKIVQGWWRIVVKSLMIRHNCRRFVDDSCWFHFMSRRRSSSVTTGVNDRRRSAHNPLTMRRLILKTIRIVKRFISIEFQKNCQSRRFFHWRQIITKDYSKIIFSIDGWASTTRRH